MYKKFTSVILSVVLLLSIVGCGTKKPSKDVSSGSSEKNTSSDVQSTESNIDNSDNSAENTNNSSNDTSSAVKTVTTTIPKQKKPSADATGMKYEYSLEASQPLDKNEIKLGKYKYVWGDEFNGTTLDLTKWSLENDLFDIYDVMTTGPVEVKDGAMWLITSRYYDPSNGALKYSCPYHVITRDTMNFEHGYLEFRARVPLTTGMWPSVWFKSSQCGLFDSQALKTAQNRKYDIECNIFEVHGDFDKLKPNIHKWYGDGRHTQGVKYRTNYFFEDTTFLTQEYHIYGFEWNESEISMFVDGEKYNTFYLSMNFDNYSDMSGFIDNVWYLRIENDPISPGNSGADVLGRPRLDEYEPSDLPAIFAVDWIRLYQDPNDNLTKLFTK